jgi:hypothetical protein
MTLNLPVDFEPLAKQPKGSGGYPVQIKASDLMKNFVYCLLDTNDGLTETTTGQGGNQMRKLKIPSPPTSGTHVLGVVDGNFTWLNTEECL